jgi:hypothetical protein
MRRRRGSMPRSPTSPSLGYSAPFRPAESPSLDPPPPYPGIAGGRPGWGLNALEGGCDENAARRC